MDLNIKNDNNKKVFTTKINGKEQSVSVTKPIYFIILLVLALILLPTALWLGGIIMNILLTILGIVAIAIVAYFGYNYMQQKK